jgi:ribosomal protein L40E
VRFEHVVLLRCVATNGGPKAQGPRRCRQGPS